MAKNVVTAILTLLAAAPFGAYAQGMTLDLRVKIFPGDDLVMFADDDGDGQLSLREMTEYLEMIGVRSTPEKLASIDMNDDSFLTAAELDEALFGGGKNLIMSMDENNDGVLSLDEFCEGMNLPTEDILHLIDVASIQFLSIEQVHNGPEEMQMLNNVTHMFVRNLSNSTGIVEKAIRNLIEDFPDGNGIGNSTEAPQPFETALPDERFTEYGPMQGTEEEPNEYVEPMQLDEKKEEGIFLPIVRRLSGMASTVWNYIVGKYKIFHDWVFSLIGF